MNRLLLTLSVVATSLLSACATMMGPVAPTYDVVLSEVERPASFRDRYAEPVITKVDSAGVARYIYEDSLITIGWIPSRTQIGFILENKSPNSMKLIWDEAAYVGLDGTSGRVMHSGVKYTEANNSQPPSVIVRGGRIYDMIVPTSNIYYTSGSYGGWNERPLFPTDHAQALAAKGRSVQVLLPLEIQGIVNEYLFTFTIQDVTIPVPAQ
jgi:hypothetical protein